MEATVIDTLRYADRLKSAGVESQQAEAMSRALNDELTGGIATKDDLGNAVDKLEGDLGRAVDKLEGDLGRAVDKLEGNLGRAVVELKGEIAKQVAKVDAKIDAMDVKFEALRDKFDSQGRYVFLVLALIAALGLYNAVAPHVWATASPEAHVKPAESTAQSSNA